LLLVSNTVNSARLPSAARSSGSLALVSAWEQVNGVIIARHDSMRSYAGIGDSVG
jgi:hypothetical protein